MDVISSFELAPKQVTELVLVFRPELLGDVFTEDVRIFTNKMTKSVKKGGPARVRTLRERAAKGGHHGVTYFFIN